MKLQTTLTMDKILSSNNIAELLSPEDLNYIAEEVQEGYELDKKSRITWEDNIKEWYDLALQVAEEKTFPWPGAANVKYPLITIAALQFNARAYPALIPGTKPVRGRVIGKDVDGSKLERAARVSKHMAYQILEQMPDWEEEMDKLLLSLPIVGCIFKKTYYDTVLQRNVSELVYPRELVVDYWAKTLDTAERITHILELTENEIYEKVESEVYREAEYKRACITENEERASDAATGVTQPDEEDDTSPFLFLEQCCYWDLDGDGYKEPYIVTVDYGSGEVARIIARYQESDVKYSDKGNIYKIIPWDFYTKFSFIPSPDGSFYDIGFGIVLGPINNTVNSLINQLLDSGTLSNLQSGFISKGIRVKGGTVNFTPGEWKYANTIGEDLRAGVFPLPVREPSQVLFSLLGMMVNVGEKVASVPEIMTGDIPGQNTKATVALAAIEQGMKVFNAVYKRIHRSLTKEYKKLFKLNSIYLDEREYFTILDEGQEQGTEIAKMDYALADVDVVPTSDPNVATEQQKLAKLEVVGQLLQLGTINPQEYTKRILEATEQPNIPALMNVPQPQPDPQVVMEQQKMQDESAQAWKKLEIEEKSAYVDDILKIAQAEKLEEGQQLEQYKQQLDLILKTANANQQIVQKEDQHQQKMDHMRQMQALKQQQATQEVNNVGPAGGNSQ